MKPHHTLSHWHTSRDSANDLRHMVRTCSCSVQPDPMTKFWKWCYYCFSSTIILHPSIIGAACHNIIIIHRRWWHYTNIVCRVVGSILRFYIWSPAPSIFFIFQIFDGTEVLNFFFFLNNFTFTEVGVLHFELVQFSGIYKSTYKIFSTA